jgi:alpha-tubulin suppressor-like RCC1 family protein
MIILFILDHILYATGKNIEGTLGIGKNKNQKEFIPVDFITNLEIMKITCGSSHTMVQCSTGIKTLIV